MNGLPQPVYVMSEPHLSGYRVIIGYETLADAQAAQFALSKPPAREDAQPVAVTIFCPKCAVPHVDEGEWATTRHHKTHQCQGCGHEWRPFPFATVGVTHPAPDVLREAAKKLAFMARTSGGTPGPDRDLMAACDAVEAALQAEQKGGA